MLVIEGTGYRNDENRRVWTGRRSPLPHFRSPQSTPATRRAGCGYDQRHGERDYSLVAISGVVIGFVGVFGEPGLAAGPLQTRVLSEETSRTVHLELNLRLREMELALIAGNAAASLATIACALLGFGVWSLVFGSTSQAASLVVQLDGVS
jgi:hypothetical protein